MSYLETQSIPTPPNLHLWTLVRPQASIATMATAIVTRGHSKLKKVCGSTKSEPTLKETFKRRLPEEH